MDIAEQIGKVEFTPSAAFVSSTNGGVTIRTKIASATPSRLYRFDVEALQRHVDEVASLNMPGGG